MHLEDLSRQMDASVRALRDAFIHENQELLLMQTAASLVEKLEQRDRRIHELEGEVAYLKGKIDALNLGDADE